MIFLIMLKVFFLYYASNYLKVKLMKGECA
nr:MAG TPA: hypothetical protein [Caudoviricetes sp.]